jgi:hypothetical protein
MPKVVSRLFPLFCLVFIAVSSLWSQPFFEPMSDTSVCEGAAIYKIIYAQAVFPEDVLEFSMDEAPAGANLTEGESCG